MQLCRCKWSYWMCSVQVEVDIFPHDRLCKVCECGFSCHLQLEARLDLSLHPFDGVTFVSPSYTLSSTAGLPLFPTARLSKRKDRKKNGFICPLTYAVKKTQSWCKTDCLWQFLTHWVHHKGWLDIEMSSCPCMWFMFPWNRISKHQLLSVTHFLSWLHLKGPYTDQIKK